MIVQKLFGSSCQNGHFFLFVKVVLFNDTFDHGFCRCLCIFLLRHDPKIKKLDFYFDKKIGWLSLTACHGLAFLG